MSTHAFLIVCLFWLVCVVIMGLYLWDTAKHQDKEEDWNEALVDDAIWEFKRRYPITRTPIGASWQDNARAAEAADNTWDGAA